MWMEWGTCYPTPQHESTAQRWYQSGYKLFLLVEVTFLLDSGSICMLKGKDVLSIYLLMVILKGTCEYLTTISRGLKELTEDICFIKIIFTI